MLLVVSVFHINYKINNFLDDEKVFAVVIRTGYLTAKGELVRSILYPPPADFQFESDSYKFIGILGVIALFCLIYTVVYKVILLSNLDLWDDTVMIVKCRNENHENQLNYYFSHRVLIF